MAKTPMTATNTRDCTLTLNASNHPDIGPDGLALPSGVPTAIPNPTPGLLDYLRGISGVTVTTLPIDPIK